MMKSKFIIISFLIFAQFSCSKTNNQATNNELESKMNILAEDYVKLVLKVGLHDPGYVDAYYGPAEWKPVDSSVVVKDSVQIQKLFKESGRLLDSLDALSDYKANEIETLRYKFLYKELLAVRTRISMLAGAVFTFDEETKNLYDVEAPKHSNDFFKSVIDKLDNALPGKGDIAERLSEFRKSFIIPVEKLKVVFSTAINECRKRTLQHITLPPNENFSVEYVKDKPWGAYNWYKGNSYSIIQVNTSLPIYIDRAVDLAAHEGYPGHHVYNTLLEKYLVNGHKWMEFTVYPLYSPQSLIAEGSANFGIQVAFPGDSRIKFEKEVLFPLAGLDPSTADRYYKIINLYSELDYAGNEAARNYINGEMNRNETIKWLQKYAMMSQERAEQRMRFIDTYRSYVINYNVGQDLVKDYVIKNGGTDNNPDLRWKIFERLLSTPQVPSNLK
ncbi:MAG: hypothetical protein P4L35_20155 [Ignavibacteriaceae bacterium]|nr:hypothetical protein [Ignavibacteriaceae bacterium]